MKNAKTILLWVLLVLVVGMIGCSSGGSSSGSSTTTTNTTTNPLVGTWNPVGGGESLTFNADGSGSATNHSLSDWTLSSTNVLNFKLNGTPEVFQLTFTNDAKTTMSLHNIGPNSSETTDYIKS